MIKYKCQKNLGMYYFLLFCVYLERIFFYYFHDYFDNPDFRYSFSLSKGMFKKIIEKYNFQLTVKHIHLLNDQLENGYIEKIGLDLDDEKNHN